MLGFHRRTRSLIPVKDLAKYDTVAIVEEEDADMDGEAGQEEGVVKANRKQLMMVYVVFLAEACVFSVLPTSAVGMHAGTDAN
jgi:hypothetical protein